MTGSRKIFRFPSLAFVSFLSSVSFSILLDSFVSYLSSVSSVIMLDSRKIVFFPLLPFEFFLSSASLKAKTSFSIVLVVDLKNFYLYFLASSSSSNPSIMPIDAFITSKPPRVPCLLAPLNPPKDLPKLLPIRSVLKPPLIITPTLEALATVS